MFEPGSALRWPPRLRRPVRWGVLCSCHPRALVPSGGVSVCQWEMSAGQSGMWWTAGLWLCWWVRWARSVLLNNSIEYFTENSFEQESDSRWTHLYCQHYFKKGRIINQNEIIISILIGVFKRCFTLLYVCDCARLWCGVWWRGVPVCWRTLHTLSPSLWWTWWLRGLQWWEGVCVQFCHILVFGILSGYWLNRVVCIKMLSRAYFVLRISNGCRILYIYAAENLDTFFAALSMSWRKQYLQHSSTHDSVWCPNYLIFWLVLGACVLQGSFSALEISVFLQTECVTDIETAPLE